MRRVDLTGERFGRLTALRLARNGGSAWLCKCDCGAEGEFRYSNLTSGQTKSCGCLHKEIVSKHGLAHTDTYHVWTAMKQRCCNPKNKRYNHYGGRGIKVCDRWVEDFQNFLDDMGEAPVGLAIERINNDGNYEPSNCRWATNREQCNNMKKTRFVTLNGERLPLSVAAEKAGISYDSARYRFRDQLKEMFPNADVAGAEYAGQLEN